MPQGKVPRRTNLLQTRSLTLGCSQCAVCGNGVVESPEECDAGDKNGHPGSGCSKDCKKTSYCGDGHVDEGEECDAGDKNGKPKSKYNKHSRKVGPVHSPIHFARDQGR